MNPRYALKHARKARTQLIQQTLGTLHHQIKLFEDRKVEISWSANPKIKRMIPRDINSEYVPALNIQINIHLYGDKHYAARLKEEVTKALYNNLTIELFPYDDIIITAPYN